MLAAVGAFEHESWGGGVQFSSARTSIWKSSQTLIKRENEKHHDSYRLGLDLAMSECGSFLFFLFHEEASAVMGRHSSLNSTASFPWGN